MKIKSLTEYSISKHPLRAGKDSFFSELEQFSFQTFFKGLAEDPILTLQNLENSLSKEIVPLRSRTFFDSLILLPESASLEWKAAQSVAQNILQQVEQNHASYEKEQLLSGMNLAEIQIETIKELMQIDKNHAKQKFKDIYKADNISQDEAEKITIWLEMVSTLIPQKYKKRLPEITLVINSENFSFSDTNSTNPLIVLTLKNHKLNLIDQMSLAFHEYLHFIEKFNPEVNSAAKSFLKSRIENETLVKMGDFSRQVNRPFDPSLENELIYPGKFIDLYMGKVYEIVDSDRTEILSVGGEALIKNPLAFYLRDPEHFFILYNLLKGYY